MNIIRNALKHLMLSCLICLRKCSGLYFVYFVFHVTKAIPGKLLVISSKVLMAFYVYGIKANKSIQHLWFCVYDLVWCVLMNMYYKSTECSMSKPIVGSDMTLLLFDTKMQWI